MLTCQRTVLGFCGHSNPEQTGFDILNYMVNGPEALVCSTQIFNSKDDIPKEMRNEQFRGTSRGLFFNNTIKRPLTPVYLLRLL